MPDESINSTTFRCFTTFHLIIDYLPHYPYTLLPPFYLLRLAHRDSLNPMPILSEKGLPLPSSSRSRPRTYFPSNPSSQTSILTHLRSRTRLTNLAVALIILLTISSISLNASYYLSPSPQSQTRYKTNSNSRTGNDRPASIEETIDRDPRMKSLNHLVMVPGHAIWIGNDVDKVEDDKEWVLEGMQKGGSVRTFMKHLEMGVEVMREDEGALLVFSG